MGAEVIAQQSGFVVCEFHGQPRYTTTKDLGWSHQNFLESFSPFFICSWEKWTFSNTSSKPGTCLSISKYLKGSVIGRQRWACFVYVSVSNPTEKGWNLWGRSLDLTQLLNIEHLLGSETSCVYNSHEDCVGQRFSLLILHLQRPRYRDENHTPASVAEPLSEPRTIWCPHLMMFTRAFYIYKCNGLSYNYVSATMKFHIILFLLSLHCLLTNLWQ